MSLQWLSQPGPSPGATWRRRLIAVTVLLVAAGAATALSSRVGSQSTPAAPVPPPAKVIEIHAGQRLLMQVKVPRDRPPDGVALRLALTARLARETIATRGSARIRYVYDVEATAARALAVGGAGGRVQAAREPVSSRIRTPVIRQFARNTCEAAALEVLLASTGVNVSQERLQAAFARSGPLDPIGTGPERTWGDPDRGYVGRPDGGGVAGGFGVYPGPVAATARTHGRRLDDLTRSTPARIYSRVLAGRAVMAWIGLSDGPYATTWRSPHGKRIEVNFGEHTIVLTGITRNGDLRVINPLRGTRETWSRMRFEAAWQLLGRRALSARA